MKTRIFTLLGAMLISFTCFSQNIQYNKKGVVKEVTFQATKDKDSIPKNAEEFKVKYLKSGKNDEFKLKNPTSAIEKD
ncbi:hypothetical protein [Prolixibacter sp. SD074]|jgi:hypothetical protein|uniref:hypothetical protein n=1 Tax=Prolixibacter sp. SD074 TaxID=2652391 RepID=UPI0012840A2B|nr:hypothetical protein [Prolixibacter sp. SD074]GET28918.1 hypothetical protein SD074_11200 [Prolixibacter sp. SD074]